MAKTTVKDLAADLNLPVETLLSQLKEAGLSQSTPADELSEADKDRFLTSLQVARGSSNAGRRKITLTKREKSVITQNGGGSSHAVQVEVRRKRVLVKNPDVVNKAREEAKKAMEEQKEKARRLAEEAAARAKEEAERKAKEEAERAAKLKAEQEKAKAEEAARRQKAEAERSIEKAKAEAEAAARAAKEAKEAAVKAEADRDAARRAAEAEARAIREMMSAPKKVLTAKKPAQEENRRNRRRFTRTASRKKTKVRRTTLRTQTTGATKIRNAALSRPAAATTLRKKAAAGRMTAATNAATSTRTRTTKARAEDRRLLLFRNPLLRTLKFRKPSLSLISL